MRINLVNNNLMNTISAKSIFPAKKSNINSVIQGINQQVRRDTVQLSVNAKKVKVPVKMTLEEYRKNLQNILDTMRNELKARQDEFPNLYKANFA